MIFGTAPYVVLTPTTVSKVVNGGVNGSANKELSDVLSPILGNEALGLKLFDAIHRSAQGKDPLISPTANSPVLVVYEARNASYNVGILRETIFRPRGKSSAHALYEVVGENMNPSQVNATVQRFVESGKSPLLATGDFFDREPFFRDGRERYSLGSHQPTRRLPPKSKVEETEEVGVQ